MSDDKVVDIPFRVNSDRVNAPDFITRVNIAELTDDQLDDMLTRIRQRRLMNYVVYKATEEQKDQSRSEKAKVALEKKCDMIIKQLVSLDKGFEKLEKYINELRGLRIQAGMSVI